MAIRGRRFCRISFRPKRDDQVLTWALNGTKLLPNGNRRSPAATPNAPARKDRFDAGLRISVQMWTYHRRTGADGYKIDRVPQMPWGRQKDTLRLQFRTQRRRMVCRRVRLVKKIAGKPPDPDAIGKCIIDKSLPRSSLPDSSVHQHYRLHRQPFGSPHESNRPESPLRSDLPPFPCNQPYPIDQEVTCHRRQPMELKT